MKNTALERYYQSWHTELRRILDAPGASTELASFLFGRHDEPPPQSYRAWVSQIKVGKRKPDGSIMAAINAWMSGRAAR